MGTTRKRSDHIVRNFHIKLNAKYEVGAVLIDPDKNRTIISSEYGLNVIGIGLGAICRGFLTLFAVR